MSGGNEFRYPGQIGTRRLYSSHTIGKLENAARLYIECDNPRAAVNAYMDARMWERAQHVARQNCPEMLTVIEQRYKNDLVKHGDGDELIRKTGDVSTALDMYARQGDWNRCFALAEKQKDPQLLQHYVLQHIKLLAQEENFAEACKVLVRYGAPPVNNSTSALYQLIARQILSGEQNPKKIQAARDMLFNVVMNRQPNSQSPPMSMMDVLESDSELVKLLLVAHFQHMRGLNRELPPRTLARTSEALLRYTTHIPVDRTFCDAGMDCKSADQVSSSFLYLNRYLDIVDAIHDDMAQVEHGEFEGTDVPNPADIEIPEKPWNSDEKNEEIRELVLGWSVSANVEQQLPTRKCDGCGKATYSAGLVCQACGARSTPCVVTGQPVSRHARVDCSNCNSVANREDWMVEAICNVLVKDVWSCCGHRSNHLHGFRFSYSLHDRLTQNHATSTTLHNEQGTERRAQRTAVLEVLVSAALEEVLVHCVLRL